MSKHEIDIQEMIERLRSKYGTSVIIEDLMSSDVVRIRRRGPGINFKLDDVIGERCCSSA